MLSWLSHRLRKERAGEGNQKEIEQWIVKSIEIGKRGNRKKKKAGYNFITQWFRYVCVTM